MITLRYEYVELGNLHYFYVNDSSIWIWYYLGVMEGKNPLPKNYTIHVGDNDGEGVQIGRFNSMDSEVNAKNIHDAILKFKV